MSKIDEVMKAWQEDHQKVSWQDLQTLKAENEALRAQLSEKNISRRLALAIGWNEKQIEESAFCDGVILPSPDPGENYRVFDYRDPSVIWPIAERFNAFPLASTSGWFAYCFSEMVVSTTAAKAVALAVIKAHEGAKK